MVEVQFLQGHAQIDGYQWTSEVPGLARLLNGMLDENGPAGHDPHPDQTAALDIIAKIGGTITHEDAAPKRLKDKDVIY